MEATNESSKALNNDEANMGTKDGETVTREVVQENEKAGAKAEAADLNVTNLKMVSTSCK